jgi:hypothetical protein
MLGDWIKVVLIYWVEHFIYSVWYILRGMARRLWYMPNWIGTTPHQHLPANPPWAPRQQQDEVWGTISGRLCLFLPVLAAWMGQNPAVSQTGLHCWAQFKGNCALDFISPQWELSLPLLACVSNGPLPTTIWLNGLNAESSKTNQHLERYCQKNVSARSHNRGCNNIVIKMRKWAALASESIKIEGMWHSKWVLEWKHDWTRHWILLLLRNYSKY